MKKPSQLIPQLVVFFTVACLGINFFAVNRFLLVIWLMALSAGYILYRSGICFSGAFIDIILFRNFTMARAVLIIIIVSLLGISVIQYSSLSHGHTHLPGFFGPMGVSNAVGAFLFGLGMVFAGACGCGTLQRLGEGFSLYIWVLLSIIVGSVIGAYHFSWWSNSFIRFSPVYLPHIFGWPWGVLISLTVLGTLYVLTFFAESGSISFQKGLTKWVKRG